MNRLDELITKTEQFEAIDMEAGAMAAETEERVSKLIQKKIQQVKPRKRKKWRVFFVLAAATMLFGSIGMAAEKNDWDIAIRKYMGLENTDTVQLPNGSVQLDKKDTETNGTDKLTVTAVSSVGDKNSFYLRVDTDYKLPADYNPDTDYYTFDNFHFNMVRKKNGADMSRFSSYGCTMETMEQNGYLSVMFYVSDCKEVNRKYITLELSDLILYQGNLNKDKTEKMIFPGEWKIEWRFDYQSNVKTYHPFRFVTCNGVKSLVNKIEVSPISIRVEAVKNPKVKIKEDSSITIKEVTMKDGTKINLENSGSGGIRNNMCLNAFVELYQFGGKALDTNQIQSITIGNRKIKF